VSASRPSIDCDGSTGSQVINDLRDNPFLRLPRSAGGGRHRQNGGRLEIGTVSAIRSERRAASDRNGWAAYVGIRTEGALWGAVSAHGFLCDAVVVSDDAGQFDVGTHALCWIHAERLVHKLEPVTDKQRCAQQHVRGLIWWFYADLKAYRLDPTQNRRRELRARFDRIFRRSTGFATLDRLLRRLHANKAELLRVLDHPEIPLHTSGSENDIRCQVTKRAVSGGTRSDTGRDCRDAFLGLAKTCRKLGVAFWDYLGARIGVASAPTVAPLSDLIRCRGQPA